MKIGHGTTRKVLILKNIVIKIPNFFYSWNHFLKGLLANMNENRAWKWNYGKYESGKSYLLCPVLWASWGGWIVIMKRADVLSHIQEVLDGSLKHLYYIEWVAAGFGGDDKADSYGYLDGKLVKVDYGEI